MAITTYMIFSFSLFFLFSTVLVLNLFLFVLNIFIHLFGDRSDTYIVSRIHKKLFILFAISYLLDLLVFRFCFKEDLIRVRVKKNKKLIEKNYTLIKTNARFLEDISLNNQSWFKKIKKEMKKLKSNIKEHSTREFVKEIEDEEFIGFKTRRTVRSSVEEKDEVNDELLRKLIDEVKVLKDKIIALEEKSEKTKKGMIGNSNSIGMLLINSISLNEIMDLKKLVDLNIFKKEGSSMVLSKENVFKQLMLELQGRKHGYVTKIMQSLFDNYDNINFSSEFSREEIAEINEAFDI